MSQSTPHDTTSAFCGLSPKQVAKQVYTKWIPADTTALSPDFQQLAVDTVLAIQAVKARVFFHGPTESFHSVDDIVAEDPVFGSCFGGGGGAGGRAEDAASQSMAAFFQHAAMKVVDIPSQLCTILQSQGIALNATSPALLCKHARDLWHGKQRKKMQRCGAVPYSPQSLASQRKHWAARRFARGACEWPEVVCLINCFAWQVLDSALRRVAVQVHSRVRTHSRVLPCDLVLVGLVKFWDVLCLHEPLFCVTAYAHSRYVQHSEEHEARVWESDEVFALVEKVPLMPIYKTGGTTATADSRDLFGLCDVSSAKTCVRH